jgi:PAS domain S-box-containing protein
VLYVLRGDKNGNRQLEFLSDSASRFFDKLPEILGDYQTMRESLEPDDLQLIDVHYLKSIQEQSILDLDFSIRKEWLPRFNRFHIQAYHDIREDGTVFTYGYITDVTSRAKSKEEEMQKSRLLEMINDLSVQVMSDNDPEAGIIRMLGSIGGLLQVDRVYLFRNEESSGDEIYTSQILEWAGEGVAPQIQNGDLTRFALHENGFSRWVHTLRSGTPVKGHIKDFPLQEKEVLSSQGIQSILVVPVIIQNQWWGFLGIDACKNEREWIDYEISVLQTAANMVGAIMQQFQFRSTLYDSKTLYQASLDAMAEGLLIKDADGTILTCNQSGLRILGLEPDQVIGKSTFDSQWGTIHEDGSPMPGGEHASMIAIKTGMDVDNQVMGLPAGDGTFRWLSVNARPIRYSGDSHPSAVVATFTDITERINTQRKQVQSSIEAQNSLSSLSRNCTNSLKMASLLLELEVLMQGSAGRKAKESSRRVSALYRIQESLFAEKEVQNARLYQLLTDLCSEMTGYYGRTSKEIQTGIRTRIKTLSSGTILPVMLAVAELVANALEHGLGTRLAGEIEVALEEQGDYLMLEVKDNGIGLPPSFNINKVNTPGLSIVKAILEGLEGTIAMHSDRGAQVLITIPLKNLGN